MNVKYCCNIVKILGSGSVEAIPIDRRFTIQNGSNVKVGILFFNKLKSGNIKMERLNQI